MAKTTSKKINAKRPKAEGLNARRPSPRTKGVEAARAETKAEEPARPRPNGAAPPLPPPSAPEPPPRDEHVYRVGDAAEFGRNLAKVAVRSRMRPGAGFLIEGTADNNANVLAGTDLVEVSAAEAEG